MVRSREILELWSLVQGRQYIDAEDLLASLLLEVERQPHDYRTRLLMHESLAVLVDRWGERGMDGRIGASRDALQRIRREHFDEVGFPSLRDRIMETTKRETVLQFLRELGDHTTTPSRMDIGGSTALILAGLLSRATEDIDVVDELPPAIRSEHRLLRRLRERYGLVLAHFQSHYLPEGWASRVRHLDRFGCVDVYLVDSCDIFVGKLFSRREKDLDDLRALAGGIDRSTIEERIASSAGKLMADEMLRDNAQRNWGIVFGDDLPENP